MWICAHVRMVGCADVDVNVDGEAYSVGVYDLAEENVDVHADG